MINLRKCATVAIFTLGALISSGCHREDRVAPDGSVGGLGPRPWEKVEGLLPFNGTTKAESVLLMKSGKDINSRTSFFLSQVGDSYLGQCGEGIRLDPAGRYTIVTGCFHTNSSGAIDMVQAQVVKGSASEAESGGDISLKSPDFKTCEDQNFNDATMPKKMLYTAVVQTSATTGTSFYRLLIQFPEGIKAILNVTQLGSDNLLNQLQGASVKSLRDSTDFTAATDTSNSPDIPVTYGCFKGRGVNSFVRRN